MPYIHPNAHIYQSDCIVEKSKGLFIGKFSISNFVMEKLRKHEIIIFFFCKLKQCMN